MYTIKYRWELEIQISSISPLTEAVREGSSTVSKWPLAMRRPTCLFELTRLQCFQGILR